MLPSSSTIICTEEAAGAAAAAAAATLSRLLQQLSEVHVSLAVATAICTELIVDVARPIRGSFTPFSPLPCFGVHNRLLTRIVSA